VHGSVASRLAATRSELLLDLRDVDARNCEQHVEMEQDVRSFRDESTVSVGAVS